jgi:CRISPR system Cascade subunit CasA
MPELYSLLWQAWVPVVLGSGRRVFVRPCEISQPYGGENIVRIATGRPDCDISLTEFLIGLYTISLEGTDARVWPDLYSSAPTHAELDVAFAPFNKAMILDGNGPRFFQDLEPLDGQPNPVSALLIDAPGEKSIKENADHFVKRRRCATLSRAGAAIVLLTLQKSAPSGGAGHRTSLRGGGPLTTLVIPGVDEGEPTLWQRLWSNVPDGLKPDADEPLWRIFPWLAKTRTSDPRNGSRGRALPPRPTRQRRRGALGQWL